MHDAIGYDGGIVSDGVTASILGEGERGREREREGEKECVYIYE